MTETADGQVCLFDQDTWCGRTYPEPLAATAAKTSKPSLKKSSKSSKQNLPLCLCLTKESGPKPDACTMKWEPGALLGEYTMHSFGECPREENVSRLSQILEDCPHPKYFLSAKACVGILNRAERRGKELPPELKAALIAQSVSKNEPENLGGAKESLSRTTEQEPCQHSITSPSLTCGNPWDSQSERVYHGDGTWHSLNANESGGQSRDAVLTSTTEPIPINTMVATRDTPEMRTTFGVGEPGDPQFTLSAAHEHAIYCAGFKAGQSADGGIGYEVEQSPTLSATPSALEPTVFCAGFSFGQSEHARSIGYQEEVSPTIRGGDGGNQKPCVYTSGTNETAGGVLPDTVGALCARDYKGVGNQYVSEGKVIVDNRT